MPFYLPEIGVSQIVALQTAAVTPEIPWHQSEEFLLVPLVLLFGAGLLLGYILFKPSAKTSLETGVDSEQDLEERTRSLAEAIQGGSGTTDEKETTSDIEAEFERTLAGLEGERDAAKSLIEQQRAEIQRRDEKLALTQTQFEEKQRRMDELVMLTEVPGDHPANLAALAHAHASIIQLSETIKSERQQVGSGISRLDQIEERVSDQKSQVLAGIETVSKLKAETGKVRGRRSRILAGRLQKLEDRLSIHHQNAVGCIQQTQEARSRLLHRQNQLRSVLKPVSNAEKRLETLERANAEESSASILRWSAELEGGIDDLTRARELAAGYKNGIRQELAGVNERVDWLTSDSSRGFFTALDGLKEAKLPLNKNLRGEFSTAERSLIATRESIKNMGETLKPTDYLPAKGDHPPLDEVFDATIQSVKTAALTPAEPIPRLQEPVEAPIDVSALESQLAELEAQLAHEKESARSLEKSLAENQSRLTEMESEAAEREKVSAVPVPLPNPAEGKNFMRRLLGLAPRQQEKPESEEEGEWEKGMTGPQVSIAKLRSAAEIVETGPIQPQNGNGHSDPDGEIEMLRQNLSEKDEQISELEREIRQLTAPIPLPSEIEAEETDTTEKEIPAVTILPLSPGRFDSSDSDVEEEGSPVPVPHEVQGEQTVIFRGDDPRTWNSDFNDSKGNFATPLDELPEGIQSLTLKRLDTGESVSLPVTREGLIAGNCQSGTRGWSGKAEHYFGSMHLGIYDETAPHEVETKFGSGGWGFGHRYEIGSGQAFAWGGHEIPPVTFEISVSTGEAGIDNTTNQQGSVGEATLLTHEGDEPEVATLPEEGLVIFRSNNPSLWNSTVYRSANHRARSLDELPQGEDAIQWLKLRRCDTNQSVVLPITAEQLGKNGDGQDSGFNGTNELFYGAHHLGVFDSTCSLDVETRFMFGGWGFGHGNSLAEDSQACGWAGEEIPADTVFEVTVFGSLPDVGPNDVLLQGK